MGRGPAVSAADAVIGYPVHAVATYRRWTNPFMVQFTDWTATCGATGFTSGHRPFGLSGSARKAELCRACWPSGSHADYHPDPVKVASDGA